nr:DUF2798 domain-containing protein [Plebeiobacterium sediminum]
MVSIMTSVITFASIAMHHGISQGFITKWIQMWGMAFSMAYPLVLVIMSPIKRFVAQLVKNE